MVTQIWQNKAKCGAGGAQPGGMHISPSNRPLEEWGKLLGDMPSATAILDRFLHHAELVTITGKSYRLRNRATQMR